MRYHILTIRVHTLFHLYIQVSNGLYCYNQTDKVDRTITLTSSAAKGGDEVSGIYYAYTTVLYNTSSYMH